MRKRKSLESLKKKFASLKRKVQEADLKAKAATTKEALQNAIEAGRKYRDKAVRTYAKIQEQAREAEKMLPNDWFGDIEEQQFKSVGSLVFGEPQKQKKQEKKPSGIVVIGIDTAELLGLKEVREKLKKKRK